MQASRGGACGDITADLGQWKMNADDGEELWRKTEEKISNKNANASNNITVIVRSRPFNKRETDLNTYNCLQMKDSDEANNQCWIFDPATKDQANDAPTKFRFDYCFDSFDPSSANFAGQEPVFRSVGLDVLAKAWTGYNACLFAVSPCLRER